MQKTTLKIINPLIFLLMINQVVTAFLRDAIGDKLFGLLHGLTGMLLAVLVIVHLILNWSWVRTQYSPRKAKDAAKTTAIQ